ncbi:hypothetical protein BVRB_2g042520 [Beta vulgaris subsp. vulgaris]|nr:hypothetical protein BVRB_2g042520 [Beta vulgaris subsp. vulgaris]
MVRGPHLKAQRGAKEINADPNNTNYEAAGHRFGDMLAWSLVIL